MNDSPDADDTPDDWQHNEYQALKMMFEGAGYYLHAKEIRRHMPGSRKDLSASESLQPTSCFGHETALANVSIGFSLKTL